MNGIGFFSLGNPLVMMLVFVTFIWALIAQSQVKSAFNKYTRVRAHRNMTGEETALAILRQHGLQHVRVERTNGFLGDHYDPKANVVRLSEAVHDQASIASVAIAAHEVGHAIQHAENYGMIGVRNRLLPFAVASSKYVFFLFFAGMVIARTGSLGYFLMDASIVLFATAVVFQGVTLPVEFDASKRAKVALQEFGYVDDDEMVGVSKMLRAAAMTYIAAFAVALAQLIRMIAVRNRR